MTKMIKCISPIDGSLYAERRIETLDETEAKIAKAMKAQQDWAQRPLSERIALLKAGVAKLGEQQERMTIELAHQIGRPIRYGGEFSGFEERALYMASIAEEALAEKVNEDSDRFLRKIVREPQGIVLVICPWNYPYMTAINTIAPALISGNAVVLKHSSQTPLVAEHLVEVFVTAGVPPDIFQSLWMDHETTSHFIRRAYFDFINFTGSVEAGNLIEAEAAGTQTSVATELGGKDPAFVMEDADLDQAVASLIDGAFFNSGQCCCGIERIYVHARLYDSFLEKAIALVKTYRLGNPLDPATTLGPMANAKTARTVRDLVKSALALGAKAQIKDFDGDDGGLYVPPQILSNVRHDMDVMTCETFGPIVGVMKVSNDEEAIALMNDSHFGLTASLWTKDLARAEALGKRIETGTIFMNRCDYLDPALCWNGRKKSGQGQGLSILGYHAVTRPKSYHMRKV